MTSTGDIDANIATCARLAEVCRVSAVSLRIHPTHHTHTFTQTAARQGARMLFLPECCAFIGQNAQETVQAARPLDPAHPDSLIPRFAAIATRHNMWLSLGGLQEPGPDADHIYNTHVIMDHHGHIQATYRKIHLFNVDVPDGPVLLECNSTAAGDKLVTVDLFPHLQGPHRLGLSICYDVRFPEMYQHLTYDMGATLLAVPSAFTVTTGKAHWELLLRARAIECQSFVIAAAQVGQHNYKRQSYGHAMVVDCWGRVLCDLGGEEEGVGVVELGDVEGVRARMPIQEHRAQGIGRILKGCVFFTNNHAATTK